jgi:hypothetical protein
MLKQGRHVVDSNLLYGVLYNVNAQRLGPPGPFATGMRSLIGLRIGLPSRDNGYALTRGRLVLPGTGVQ